MAKGYIGWALPETEREHLLAYFKPAYPDVIAHHVTMAFGVDENTALPEATRGTIVGIADDREKVQALVVEIDGTTDRPDGSTYHITWSIDREKGGKPVQSNQVIKDHGWESVPRIPVKLVPTFFAN